MHRFTKQWEMLWNGHQIVVKNWWDWNLHGGEELLIDGQKVDQYEGWAKFSRDLEGTLFLDSKEHRVRVHLGSVDFGFRVGCQIFIDDMLVGGDTRKKFIT